MPSPDLISGWYQGMSRPVTLERRTCEGVEGLVEVRYSSTAGPWREGIC